MARKRSKPETRGQQFARITNAELVLSPAEQALLVIVGRAIDETDRLEGMILRQGDTVKDRFGAVQPHPAVRIRDEARRVVIEVLGQLGLGTEGGPPVRPEGEAPDDEENGEGNGDAFR